MNFNISFDATALVFLLVVVWRFFTQRQFPLVSNRMFGALLLLGVANLLLDMGGTLVLEYIQFVPLWLVYLINGLCYAIQGWFPTAITTYILALTETSRRTRRTWYVLCALPAILYELALLVAVPRGLVFQASPETGYAHGPLSVLPYVCVCVYLCMSVCMLGIYRQRLSRDERRSLLVMIVTIILGALVQFLFPSLLVTGVAITAGLLIMFFTLQDPGRMLDTTTQLFNRAGFLLSLRANLAPGRPFSLTAINVDGLQQVNTLFGTREGEAVLQWIGGLLSGNKKCWAFHTDQSHFAVITAHPEADRALLQLLQEKHTVLWAAGDGSVPLTLNVCHVARADQLQTPENVLMILNHVLSERNLAEHPSGMIELDERTMARIRRESDIENALRAALPTGEGFELYYQPIFHPGQDRFYAAEALLRYNHPTLGQVPPGEFVTIAENAGLGCDMDEMVLELFFRELASGVLSDLGLDHIQVNLSASSFASRKITERILALTRQSCVDTRTVVFEITESASLYVDDTVRNCMQRLVQAGYRFALDDFGTGYANIRRMLELPLAYAKMDRSLLFGSASVYEALVRIFDRLNMEVEAEGVETLQQAQFVIDAGVSSIQGYYYARPMNNAQLHEFLNAEGRVPAEVRQTASLS